MSYENWGIVHVVLSRREVGLPVSVQSGNGESKGKNEYGETPQEAVAMAPERAHSILELGGGREDRKSQKNSETWQVMKMGDVYERKV